MNNSVGEYTDAGAVSFGGTQAAPAQFEVGSIGFGPHWSAEDSMAASIIRLEQENQELRAEVALLQEQARIMSRELDARRDAACAESCRDKAEADAIGGNRWANI
jgi:hypothetical protein